MVNSCPDVVASELKYWPRRLWVVLSYHVTTKCPSANAATNGMSGLVPVVLTLTALPNRLPSALKIWASIWLVVGGLRSCQTSTYLPLDSVAEETHPAAPSLTQNAEPDFVPSALSS